jgi:hypothetical protein
LLQAIGKREGNPSWRCFFCVFRIHLENKVSFWSLKVFTWALGFVPVQLMVGFEVKWSAEAFWRRQSLKWC